MTSVPGCNDVLLFFYVRPFIIIIMIIIINCIIRSSNSIIISSIITEIFSLIITEKTKVSMKTRKLFCHLCFHIFICIFFIYIIV